MTQTEPWIGPYMRYKLNEADPGVRNGTLSSSPDLIPFGRSTTDPAQFIDGKWTQDVGTSTTAKVTNYLYVRGANNSAKSMAAKVYLYYSPARLLQWPNGLDGVQGWAERPLQTGSGQDYQELEVAGNGRFVTPAPFEWKPKELPDDHYCLVGRVSTDAQPNPIPSGLAKIDDFARYISVHPDLAWRNVYLLVPGNDVWTDSPLYLQGEQTSEMVVTVYITGGRAGDLVTVKASEPGPAPAIDMTLQLKGEAKEQLTRRTVVPASWKSTVVITYEAAKGHKVPDGLKAELSVLKVGIDPDSDLAAYARPLRDLGVKGIDDAEQIAIPVGATNYSTSVADAFELV